MRKAKSHPHSVRPFVSIRRQKARTVVLTSLRHRSSCPVRQPGYVQVIRLCGDRYELRSWNRSRIHPFPFLHMSVREAEHRCAIMPGCRIIDHLILARRNRSDIRECPVIDAVGVLLDKNPQPCRARRHNIRKLPVAIKLRVRRMRGTARQPHPVHRRLLRARTSFRAHRVIHRNRSRSRNLSPPIRHRKIRRAPHYILFPGQIWQ